MLVDCWFYHLAAYYFCNSNWPRSYLLVEFCKLFETLYRPDYCNTNLHMSWHLRNCLYDFGSFSSSDVFHMNTTMAYWKVLPSLGFCKKNKCIWKFQEYKGQTIKYFNKLDDDFLSTVYEQFNWKLRVIIVHLVSHKHKIF